MRFPTLLRGLAAKLVLLHLLWIVPALLLADYWVLQREAAILERALDAGALQRAGNSIADDLLRDWPNQRALELSLERHRLRLERARDGFAPGIGHILLELSETPLGLSLHDSSGRLLASSGPMANTFGEDRLHAVATLARAGMVGPLFTLQLQINVPRPSLASLSTSSFEWRVLLSAGVLLALVGTGMLSLYLVRRLNGIGRAVAAWRRGDLAQRIGENRRDELGSLAAELDGMAADLQQLVEDRARLATLQERQRVARDLHDTAKQKAFALGLQLAALRRSLPKLNAPPALEEAERLCAELRTELAELVHTFKSEPAPKQPFRNRLDARARRWQMSAGLQLRLRLDPGPEPSPAHAEQLLRALDEALANVARHAQVDQASVQLLDRSQGRWSLRISDQGVGFDPGRRSGTGLAHLSERAERLFNGQLQIDSSRGRGTTISLHFEIAPDAAGKLAPDSDLALAGVRGEA